MFVSQLDVEDRHLVSISIKRSLLNGKSMSYLLRKTTTFKTRPSISLSPSPPTPPNPRITADVQVPGEPTPICLF